MTANMPRHIYFCRYHIKMGEGNTKLFPFGAPDNDPFYRQARAVPLSIVVESEFLQTLRSHQLRIRPLLSSFYYQVLIPIPPLSPFCRMHPSVHWPLFPNSVLDNLDKPVFMTWFLFGVSIALHDCFKREDCSAQLNLESVCFISNFTSSNT